MEGFEREIDTELFNGLLGGSGLVYGLFPKKVEHPCSLTPRPRLLPIVVAYIMLHVIFSLSRWST